MQKLSSKQQLYLILLAFILSAQIAVVWYFTGNILGLLLCTSNLIIFYLITLLMIPKIKITEQDNAILNIPEVQTKMFPEKSEQLEEALKTLAEIKQQLVIQEKMAAIGVLSAGVAHEIKNPLNFINNFSDMTTELLKELQEEITKLGEKIDSQTHKNLNGIIEDIIVNCKKINEHGKRAESIIKNMLIQARTSEIEKTPVDVNELLEEFVNLSYHGMRAQNQKFNVKIEKNLDRSILPIIANQQNLGRVFINIINNGLYAANEKSQQIGGSFMPTISVNTEQNDDYVTVKIKDNGNGIPENLRKKIFEPFFTTKPPGEGTGLGLPMCHDIVVKEHNGILNVVSTPLEFTEFTIMLPKEKKH